MSGASLPLPDPLGLFGEPTDLLGRKHSTGGLQIIAPPDTKPLDATATKERPMPTQNDAEVKRQRRKSVAQQRARSGRASTIFTEGYGLGG